MPEVSEHQKINLSQAAIQYIESLQLLGESEITLDHDLLLALQKYGKSAQSTPTIQESRKTYQYQSKVTTSSKSHNANSLQPVRQQAPPITAKFEKLSAEKKVSELAALQQVAADCQKCSHLARSRKQVVFGVGHPSAEIMFVGEAPGADEDKQGEPFVGAAGKLLTKMIQAMGLSRDDVYIGNVLKCRPDMPPNTSGNRKPTLDEMSTCRPYLAAQIGIIQPKVLVALGSTAVEGLLSKPKISITRIRGRWHSFQGIPLMPTFHPAYLLYQNRISDKRKVWEDLLMVMEHVDIPISDKQRNYFLNQIKS